MIAIDHVSTGTEKENENETSRCVIIKCIWCVGYKCIASNAFPCNFKDTNELEIFENVWKTPVKGEKGR